MTDQHEEKLEELCQTVYNGNWRSFLVDLKKRMASPVWKTLPHQKRENVIRDIGLIKQRLER